jgi:hypothetical protein
MAPFRAAPHGSDPPILSPSDKDFTSTARRILAFATSFLTVRVIPRLRVRDLQVTKRG